MSREELQNQRFLRVVQGEDGPYSAAQRVRESLRMIGRDEDDTFGLPAELRRRW